MTPLLALSLLGMENQTVTMYCHHERHDEPCKQPCGACDEDECNTPENLRPESDWLPAGFYVKERKL